MGESNEQSARMSYFSKLAGPFTNLPKKTPYKVSFINLHYRDNHFYRNWTKFVALGTLGTVLWFGYVLFDPKHWIITQQPDSSLYEANFVMLLCLALLQIFAIVLTVTATRSTLIAKNPLPVTPPKGLRVAFVTTRAPGEPVEMVQKTLEAAKRINPVGSIVDVWLLDETNDQELQRICREIQVKYFSRAGVEKWNTQKHKPRYFKIIWQCTLWGISFGKFDRPQKLNAPDPFLAARSKHGNFNSWRAYLSEMKISYDILAGVDTDQVPEVNYLQRLLGYFRDENVAYVVGPQVYANYGSGLSLLVARLAESQASFFQSTVQRAGNASASPMFVGTNYAVRMPVLDQINGFQPCITEDMATGLAIHIRRNPTTGKRWKSVYTPDVLALGEGPDLWGAFFTQQWRWAAGTFDTWRKVVWRNFFRLSPKAMLHYFLMLMYYPISALTWLMSVVSSMTYLLTGATAILAPWNYFVSLYLTVVVMQLSLYFWNRRFNVSPHEPIGSYGAGGMIASTLMAPIYFSALLGIILGKKPHFVVTKKGATNSFDSIVAFKTHLQWAFIISLGLVYGFLNGHDHPAMLVWAGLLLVVCLAPVTLGMARPFRNSFRKFGTDLHKVELTEEGTNNA